MKILISDINKFKINEKSFNENILMKFLSHEELLRLDNIKNVNRKLQFLIGRLTLRVHLGKVFSKKPNDINIFIKENGAILIKEDPQIYASISHSQNLVCVALNDQPLGIDIEYQKEKKDFLKLAKFSFNDNFAKMLSLKSPKEQKSFFYTEWTKKEAIFKLKSLAKEDNFLDKRLKILTKTIKDDFILTVVSF